MSEGTPAAVLTIAGSDSGGGAGIQADLKAFAACGVHGTSAITAVTAQNTVAVEAVHAVPPAMIRAQVDAVVGDFEIAAVKVGMLGDVATIEAVAASIEAIAAPVVLDPVMVAESGARLLATDAVATLRDRLLPLASVVTPNLPEAEILAGDDVDPAGDEADPAGDEAHVEFLARVIQALGPAAVVITGGHRMCDSDLFFDGVRAVALTGERAPDGAAHGSGCTHSSVLAARLALGDAPLEAARVARRLAGRAVQRGLRELGSGSGPVDVLDIRSGAGGPALPLT